MDKLKKSFTKMKIRLGFVRLVANIDLESDKATNNAMKLIECAKKDLKYKEVK